LSIKKIPNAIKTAAPTSHAVGIPETSSGGAHVAPPVTVAGVGVVAAPSMIGAALPFVVFPVGATVPTPDPPGCGPPIPVPLPPMITGRAIVPRDVIG
jgi:hypothetical protein